MIPKIIAFIYTSMVYRILWHGINIWYRGMVLRIKYTWYDICGNVQGWGRFSNYGSICDLGGLSKLVSWVVVVWWGNFLENLGKWEDGQ